MKRWIEKVNRFVEFGRSIAALSTCRRLQVGAIVFPPDCTGVWSIGYNGPAAGLDNDSCTCEEGDCGCIHAESNAVLKLLPQGDPCMLFCTQAPCWRCAGMIINCGRIFCVIYDELYRDDRGTGMLVDAGIKICPTSFLLGKGRVQREMRKEIRDRIRKRR